MTEFNPCDKCKNSIRPGYILKKNEEGYEVFVECDCHKKWKKETLLEVKCRESGISTIHYFSDYLGKKSSRELGYIKDIANNFSKYRNKVMYLYGKNGTQKTSTALALGRELIDKGWSVYYTSMNELISLLVNINSFDESTEEAYYTMERIKKCDLLILDESFDAEKVTIFKSGYQIPFLDTFLKNRFDREGKAILFVSNIRPTNISGYGESLRDWVIRNTIRSIIYFKDNYQEELMKSNLDPNGIFTIYEENNQ